eukprot:gene6739-3408_t
MESRAKMWARAQTRVDHCVETAFPPIRTLIPLPSTSPSHPYSPPILTLITHPLDLQVDHCVEIASHRHGCCVLQRCIDFASTPQKRSLIQAVASHSLALSQDSFGNYVVQYILELGQSEASSGVIRALTGHFAELAMQKFSSNVVEKCLSLSGVDSDKEVLIKELVNSPLLNKLLQDAYGNYVIQSVLNVTSGALHAEAVNW